VVPLSDCQNLGYKLLLTDYLKQVLREIIGRTSLIDSRQGLFQKWQEIILKKILPGICFPAGGRLVVT
jgi:hypothetical protein